jgi:hypothetical protein
VTILNDYRLPFWSRDGRRKKYIRTQKRAAAYTGHILSRRENRAGSSVAFSAVFIREGEVMSPNGGARLGLAQKQRRCAVAGAFAPEEDEIVLKRGTRKKKPCALCRDGGRDHPRQNASITMKRSAFSTIIRNIIRQRSERIHSPGVA